MIRPASFLAALGARMRRACPSRRMAVLGTCLWGACSALNASGTLWLRGWRGLPLAEVGLLFATGAALAFVPGVWLGRLLGGRTRPEKVFAAVFLCLACASVAVTGLLFAWQYRAYYARWHAAAFTVIWVFQLVFTALSALYQFAVLGLPLFFPLSFAGLFLVAFRTARHMR